MTRAAHPLGLRIQGRGELANLTSEASSSRRQSPKLLDYNLSVAVAVGFIALVGSSAQTGVVMLLCADRAWDRVVEAGKMRFKTLVEAIEHGAVSAFDRN